MNKIALIIKREYLVRVKKKSFIIMTILGPILIAAIMIVPIWLSMQKSVTISHFQKMKTDQFSSITFVQIVLQQSSTTTVYWYSAAAGKLLILEPRGNKNDN